MAFLMEKEPKYCGEESAAPCLLQNLPLSNAVGAHLWFKRDGAQVRHYQSGIRMFTFSLVS